MSCELLHHSQGWTREEAPARMMTELRASHSFYGKIKGAGDCCLALVILVLTAPLLLLAALLVKATSRGPVLYSQVRLGRGGKPFRIYKIRTMQHECEKHSGARWCTPGDA